MSFHYIIRCRACDTVMRECRCPSDNKLVAYNVCTKCQQKITSVVKLIDPMEACVKLASGKYKVVDGNLEGTHFCNLVKDGEDFLLWLGPTVVLPTSHSILEALKTLTDEQRRTIIKEFCHGCGSMDTGCQCWNDE